ncbi:MAG TPA: hypothetical protein VHL53_14195, partial [Acidimicrobiia bacterium]|nr:hypothetical protein [Acidimicrobiia bacterium]
MERKVPDPVIDLTETPPAGGELVPVPRPAADPDGLDRSDVDGWGRSEHLRRFVRTVYDPLYSHRFR